MLLDEDGEQPRGTCEVFSSVRAARSAGKRTRFLCAIVVGCVLILHVLLLMFSACRRSPTSEELGALAAGVWHWQSGRFDLGRESPPLPRLLAAIPAFVCGVRLDEIGRERPLRADTIDSRVRRLASAAGERIVWWTITGRLLCIPISLLGAGVCYWWAQGLFGPRGGMCAVIWWCFSPSVLGEGVFVASAVSNSSLIVAAMYLCWRWCRAPTMSQALAAGVVLGLASLCDVVSLLLACGLPLLWGLSGHCSGGKAEPSWLLQMGQLTVLLLATLYVINLCYGFERTCRRLGEYSFGSRCLGGPFAGVMYGDDGDNRFNRTGYARLRIPLPEHYVGVIDHAFEESERVDRSTHLGEQWESAKCAKVALVSLGATVPLGMWAIIVGAATGVIVKSPPPLCRSDQLFLLLPAVSVFLANSLVGYESAAQSVVAVLPFLLVWGASVTLGVREGRCVRVAYIAAASSWLVASCLWCYPHV